MKKILITGASGFVGVHLVEYLANLQEYEIFGTVFDKTTILETWLDKKHIIKLDLINEQLTDSTIAAINPEYVIHLAALSDPGKSFQESTHTLVNNIAAQANVLNALVSHQILAKTLVIGSAEEYGFIKNQDKSIDENVELRPLSPYGVSKITQDYMGLQYHLAYKLPVIRIRSFNHTGEGQAPSFVVAAFAKQIAQIEAGLQPAVIKVGNLEPIRDFTDVKDIIRAYELALDHCEPGEVYNLGSGRGVKIAEILDQLIALSKNKITIEIDNDRFRPADVKRLIANNQKFKQATNWKPEISLDATLSRVLNYWRGQIKK